MIKASAGSALRFVTLRYAAAGWRTSPVEPDPQKAIYAGIRERFKYTRVQRVIELPTGRRRAVVAG